MMRRCLEPSAPPQSIVRAAITLLAATFALGCGANMIKTPAADADVLSHNATGAPAGRSCAVTQDCAVGLTCFGAPLHCAPPASPAMTQQGGQVLAAVKVHAVVWRGDEDLGRKLDAFNAQFLACEMFAARLAEYGVGTGSAAGVVKLGAPPPSVRASGASRFEYLTWSHSHELMETATKPPSDYDPAWLANDPRATARSPTCATTSGQRYDRRSAVHRFARVLGEGARATATLAFPRCPALARASQSRRTWSTSHGRRDERSPRAPPTAYCVMRIPPVSPVR